MDLIQIIKNQHKRYLSGKVTYPGFAKFVMGLGMQSNAAFGKLRGMVTSGQFYKMFPMHSKDQKRQLADAELSDAYDMTIARINAQTDNLIKQLQAGKIDLAKADQLLKQWQSEAEAAWDNLGPLDKATKAISNFFSARWQEAKNLINRGVKFTASQYDKATDTVSHVIKKAADATEEGVNNITSGAKNALTGVGFALPALAIGAVVVGYFILRK